MKAQSSSVTAGKVVGGVFGILFATVWIAGWTAGTLTFDVVWVRAALKQHRATNYPTTLGTVVGSRVRESSDSEGGTNYSADVRYAYHVSGRRYECDRYRHGVTGSGRGHARARAAAYPVGRAVTVYYNPADPSDAVLRPGLRAGDFFMPLFMTPFNLVMLASWLVVGAAVTSPLRTPPPAGVRVRHEGMRLRLRPEGFPPLGAAAIAAGLAAVPCIFAGGLAGGPDAPTAVVVACWMFVVATTVFAYLRTARRLWSGDLDLVIDPWRKSMTLPLTHGRNSALDIDFADVTGIDVEHRTTTDSDNDVTHHYLPTVRYTDREGVERGAALAQWGDEKRAQRLAAWLRERVGIEQPGAGPTAAAPA